MEDHTIGLPPTKFPSELPFSLRTVFTSDLCKFPTSVVKRSSSFSYHQMHHSPCLCPGLCSASCFTGRPSLGRHWLPALLATQRRDFSIILSFSCSINFPSTKSFPLVCKHSVISPSLTPMPLYLIPIFFGNTFIEIQFTYHTVHPFQVYNAVVFSLFTWLCNHHHKQF